MTWRFFPFSLVGQRLFFRVLFGFFLLMLSTYGKASSDVQVFAVGANRSFKNSLTPLKFAESDAQRFVEAMKTVGLVPQLRAVALTDPTVADFREAMQILIKDQDGQGRKISREDLASRKFIFFFSGHSDDRGIHLKDGLITKDELHDSLSAVKAHTKVAILDSCFSGAISSKGVEPAPEFELPKVEFDEPSGSVFLSASTGRQLAYESDSLEGSVFTHHMLRGLYGDADGNADGVVTVDELYQYVYRNTKWQSLNYPTRTTQEPEYVADLKGQGAIVLSFPSKTNSKLQLEKALSGEITIAAAKGLQFFKIEKTPGQMKTVQLPVGSYNLSIRDGNRIGEGIVKIEPLKLAALGDKNFTWRQADVEVKKVAKGEDLGSEIKDDDRLRYGFAAGVHSGYFSQIEYGPYVELSLMKSFARFKRLNILWNGMLNFHQNNLEKDNLESKSQSLGIYGGLKSRLESPLNMAGSFMGLCLGLGQTQHKVKKEYSDGTTWTENGLAASLVYGLEFGFIAGNGRELAVAIRSEDLGVFGQRDPGSQASAHTITFQTSL